jgi:4-hydroxybenzoate polyprenyltransferase
MRHKGHVDGPVVMGLCRALVYAVTAAGAARISAPVLAAAAAMWVYVVALSVVAKQAGPRAASLMPWLIAGIALVDAAVIGLFGGGWLVGAAIAAFLLTRVLQRFIPGT